MILGILATIAVPKFLKTSARAHDNATKQSLSVVRNAIELYTADNNGELPGQNDDLETDLLQYLRGTFPVCQPRGNADILHEAANTVTASNTDAQGWRYSTTTGQFIVNSTDVLNSEPDGTVTYDQL